MSFKSNPLVILGYLVGAATLFLLSDSLANGARAGSGFLARRLQDDNQAGGMPPGSQAAIRLVYQILFGVVYYFLIVTKYKELSGSTSAQAAKDLQKLNAISACCQTCPNANCFHSFCCSGARAAQTTDKVGVLPYWPALILFSIFPCCTLCYTNACTDMNKKLGGDEQNVVMAILCAWFCTGCVIQQDAECLDIATGQRTTLCGVEGRGSN